MTDPDQVPGRAFDAWSELKWAVAELHALSARLAVHLDADDDHQAIVWDEGSWRAADLLERALADVGTLSGTYVRLMIASQTGRDPLA